MGNDGGCGINPCGSRTARSSSVVIVGLLFGAAFRRGLGLGGAVVVDVLVDGISLPLPLPLPLPSSWLAAGVAAPEGPASAGGSAWRRALGIGSLRGALGLAAALALVLALPLPFPAVCGSSSSLDSASSSSSSSSLSSASSAACLASATAVVNCYLSDHQRIVKYKDLPSELAPTNASCIAPFANARFDRATSVPANSKR